MPDLERILQNTPGSLSQQWYEDGVAVDPGTVTVGITRADGTSLVSAGTATTGSGTAARTFNLTTTHTGLLDTLTVTWTSTLKGTLVSTVEVAGGFLFTIAEFQALFTGFTAAQVIDMRVTVEQEIEQACGVAFVPRYALETVDGSGGRSLMLRPMLRTVRSATVDGSVFSSQDLAYLTLGTTGTVYSTSRVWSAGSLNVLVGYEHGYPSVPLGIKRAALMLAKMWLAGDRSPIDDRAATFSSNEGGTYSLVVPGRNGSVFGHPDVDSAVQRYSLVTGIA